MSAGLGEIGAFNSSLIHLFCLPSCRLNFLGNICFTDDNTDIADEVEGQQNKFRVGACQFEREKKRENEKNDELINEIEEINK